MLLLAVFAIAGLCSRPTSVGPRPAACSCVLDPNVRNREELRNLLPHTATVFEGVVVGPAPAPPSDGPAIIAVRVLVDRRWRGSSGDTVTVATPRATTACGADLIPGKRYLIFADTIRAGALFTVKCLPTRQWDAKADTLAGWLGSPQHAPAKSRTPDA